MTTISAPKAQGTITWFDHAGPDAAGARDFYKNLFGWDFMIGGPETGFYGMAHLGGRMVAGLGETGPDMHMPPAWTVYFAGNDLGAITQRVQELGGMVLVPPMAITEFGHMAVFADPAGAAFGVWQAGLHNGFGVVDEPGSMAWCEVNSRDAVKSRDFYCALFGLTWQPMQGGMEYYTLHLGDVTVGGVNQLELNVAGDMPSHWMPYFTVADADAAGAAILAAGGKHLMPAFDTPFGRILMVSDPFGAYFSILQPPAG